MPTAKDASLSSPTGPWEPSGVLGRTYTTQVDRGCGWLGYEIRKAGHQAIELKCPRSSDLSFDYVVAIMSPYQPPLAAGKV